MTGLPDAITVGLDRPVPPEVRRMSEGITRRHGETVAAVLFYGSCLRRPDAAGVLDLYVLVDDYRAFHGSRPAALANALLPPTVLYEEAAGVRAKVAVISRRQFARRVRPASLDTTLWARFCQPAVLAYARDAEAARQVAEAFADAAATAAGWAVRLGPKAGTARDYWTALFRHTYGAELRVERGTDRAGQIHDDAPAHFDRLLAPALRRAGIKAELVDGRLHPRVDDRAAAARAWRYRRLAGKPLNLMRLVKGAFTFAPHADYIAWKVERHTGRPLRLTPFQRRHPVLAAPWVLWRLYRHGTIR